MDGIDGMANGSGQKGGVALTGMREEPCCVGARCEKATGKGAVVAPRLGREWVVSIYGPCVLGGVVCRPGSGTVHSGVTWEGRKVYIGDIFGEAWRGLCRMGCNAAHSRRFFGCGIGNVR